MESEDKVFPDISDDDIFETAIGPYLPDLIKLLKQEDIKYHHNNSPEDDDDELVINFPTQRSTIDINIFTVDEVKMLLNSNFTECKLLQNYLGLYNPTKRLIECIVTLQTNTITFRNPVKRFNNILLKSPNDPFLSLEISCISKELAALTTNNMPRLSLKIKGVNLRNSNPEVLLEKYSDSLFFQFELINERLFSLGRRKPSPQRTKRGAPSKAIFPEIELEKGPMALYWHARDAAQLPMFQFLAYYQSVEYFFPRLSRQAAHKKVQSLLKDPSFRASSDSDVEKIFNTIKLTNTGRLGDEKSQLQAVISECLLAQEICDFIMANPVRNSHFTENIKKTTSSVKITLNDPKGIIGTTAARLYDIRCKVVHTKNDDSDAQTEMLLPNSPESDLLRFDIELMRFIAQKVLIHTSTRLH